MARPEKRLANGASPVTVVILAMAFAAHLSAPFAAILVYDRQAILAGDLWRLLTGPLVHFSGDHLFFNALILAAAGYLVERKHSRLFAHLCVAAALAGSFSLLLWSPGISVFGGLSGIATMAVVFLAADEIRSEGGYAILWSLVLVLTAGKILLETALGSPVFAAHERFVPVPSAHVAGALVAFAGQWLLHRRTASGLPV